VIHRFELNSETSGELTGNGETGDAAVAGWGAVTGSRRVEPEEVDRAFGMPVGKLRGRAGIDSLSYAVEGETEVTLGVSAARNV